MRILIISIIVISSVLININLLQASNNSINIPNKHQYYSVTFTYTNVINGKDYTEEAVLLRDKSWLASNGIHKAGDTLVLNIPEFGVVNAKAITMSVEISDANPEAVYTNNQSMVIGTFKHYAVDVREYTLQDSKTGIIQTIEATPNHAFYVRNRTAFNKALNEQSHFIEIQHITSADHMLNETGNSVELVCDTNNGNGNQVNVKNKVSNTLNKGNNKIDTKLLLNGSSTNCYKQLVTNNKPIAVYNLEIYKQHQYLVVSNSNINQENNTNSNLTNEDVTNTSEHNINKNIITTDYNKPAPINTLFLDINNAVLVHNICSPMDVAGGTGGGDDPNWNRPPVNPQDPLERRKATHAKYDASDAGKATRTRYKASDAGKATRARYKASDAGKATRARTNLVVKAKTLGFANFNHHLADEYINSVGDYYAFRDAAGQRNVTKQSLNDFLANRNAALLPDIAPAPIANPMADFFNTYITDDTVPLNESQINSYNNFWGVPPLPDLGTGPIVPLLPEDWENIHGFD